ncbi:MAG: heme exporter protein CcmD [Chromatiales bacterium]|nr:heme exporter protein CcmD [Chromatiales bacterium]
MEFFALDKYAIYVWAVYGLSLLLVVTNSWLSRQELKKTKQRVLRRLASRQTSQSNKGETAE